MSALAVEGADRRHLQAGRISSNSLDFAGKLSIAVVGAVRDRALAPTGELAGLMVVEAGNCASFDQETIMTNLNEPTPYARAPREHTKTARMVDLLKTSTGAGLEDMVEATGWQSHTVRAALTGLRKRGYVIDRKVEGSVTIWSLSEPGA